MQPTQSDNQSRNNQLPPDQLPPTPEAIAAASFQPSYQSNVPPPAVQNDQMANTASGASRLKRSRKGLVIGLLSFLGLVVVLVGVTVILKTTASNSPNGVFQKALANALTTNQLEAKTTLDSGVIGTITTDAQYDFSDSTNPRIDNKFTTNIIGNIRAEAYADAHNNFLKYGQINSGDTNSPVVLDKWVQIRKNGKYDPGYATLIQPSNSTAGDTNFSSANFIPDPRELLLGQYIHGNFSAKDRGDLLDYIKANKLYQYNSKQVVKANLNGQKVYVYSVTFDTDKLTSYDTKVAALFGIPEDDLGTFINDQGFSSTRNAKLYVAIGTKQLVKFEAKDSYGNTQVTTYNGFNSVPVLKEPSAELPFSQLQPLLNVPAQAQSIGF